MIMKKIHITMSAKAVTALSDTDVLVPNLKPVVIDKCDYSLSIPSGLNATGIETLITLLRIRTAELSGDDVAAMPSPTWEEFDLDCEEVQAYELACPFYAATSYLEAGVKEAMRIIYQSKPKGSTGGDAA
jgi:hypothetical protein